MDDIRRQLANIERNQELTMKMVRLILEELGLRKAIQQLDKEMEARNGSDAPPAVGGAGG